MDGRSLTPETVAAPESDLEETSCPVGAFAAGPYSEEEEEIVTDRLRSLGYM